VFGGDVSPEEWGKHLADVDALNTWRGKIRPAVVLLMLGGAGMPNALIRQKLATLTSKPEYNPYLAIVTSNPLIRGALSALRWLQSAPPNYEADTFARTEQAIGWLEQRRGEPLPELTGMIVQSRVALERPMTAAR
jgi:hypothetical protein